MKALLKNWKARVVLVLAVIGPGFITANVDNDAGGIATYSVAGAQYGYSLLWPEGSDFKKFPWKTGSMVVPPNDWFHQHFNPGTEPARYLALRWGSQRYDLGGAIQAGEEAHDVSVKDGGLQIEYADEDPTIHREFEESLARAGATCRMRSMVPSCTAE